MNDYQPWEFTCKTCGGHNQTVLGAYFQLNVLTSNPGRFDRNLDIWIPGSRSTGSERKMASYDQ